MEEKSENVMDLIWDRTLELFIKIHDCPDNPEHFDSLVHWLNENPAHAESVQRTRTDMDFDRHRLGL